MVDKYFLPDEYKKNDEITSESDVSVRENYWDESRIRLSAIYQWHVYQYAGQISKKYAVKNVLDVGCGVGTKLSMLKSKYPSLECSGVDQPHAIKVCTKKFPNCKWFDADIREKKSIVSDGADLVLSVDVIEHLSNPDTLIDFVRANCTKKTKVIFSTPDRDKCHGAECLYSPNPAHVREWNFSEFRQYIESKGIKVIEHFHVPAYRLALDKPILKQEILRILKFKPRKNNQIILGEFQ